jgi:hypothetical protein
VRICFIATRSIRHDPRTVAQANSTRSVGHEVLGVSADEDDLSWVVTSAVPSLADRVGRRGTSQRLVRAAEKLHADIYVPRGPAAVDIAREAAQGSGVFLTEPAWDQGANESDLLWRAPTEPSLSLPAGGEVPTLHVPSYRPVPARTSGPVHIVYRKTERNPGRYLEAALRRRGLETTHGEEIEWGSVPRGTLGVVVVESPLPSLPVQGSNPGIPVVFWVHHGEHHLDANIRLQRHYGAHAVALAHSWHLAYRFTGLVDRLPFGVAPELGGHDFIPHDRRRFDVAFVGSSAGTRRYRRRAEALSIISSSLGQERVAVADNMIPEEMSALYRNSRIVPDDSAGRHLPITMRVFEAAGAGALLVTRAAPGMGLLFEGDEEFIPMTGDGVGQVIELVAGDTESIGRAGHMRTWTHHTYDRRVDDLVSMFSRIRDLGLEALAPMEPPAGLPGAVTAFPDAQRVLDLDAGLDPHLADREVWEYTAASSRAEPNTFHVSVIAGGSPGERRRAVAAARTAVVTEAGLATEIEKLVTDEHGQHSSFHRGEVVMFTFGGFGYRVSNAPDPQSTT